MEIFEIAPPPGFLRFSRRVLRTRWRKILGVPAMMEGLLGLGYLVIALCWSQDAANGFMSWLVSHPIIVFGPSLMVAAWIFACELHREHAARLKKTKRCVRNVRLRAQELLHDVADMNGQMDRTKADCAIQLRRARAGFERALREKDSEIHTLQSSLDDKEHRSNVRAMIGSFIEIGEQLRHDIPQDHGSFEAWKGRYALWVQGSAEQIRLALGDSEVSFVASYRGLWLKFNDGPSNEYLNYIGWYIDALRDLMKRLGV